MRIYDGRLGRFLSVDPLTKDFAFYSPYQFSGNSPIENVDLDGLEPLSNGYVTEQMRKGKPQIKISTQLTVWPGGSSPKSKQNGNYISKSENLTSTSQALSSTPGILKRIDNFMKANENDGFDGAKGQAEFHAGLDNAAGVLKNGGLVTTGYNPLVGVIVYKTGDILSTANGYMRAAAAIEDHKYIEGSIQFSASTVGLIAGDKVASLFKDKVKKVAATYLTDKVIDKTKDAVKEKIDEKGK